MDPEEGEDDSHSNLMKMTNDKNDLRFLLKVTAKGKYGTERGKYGVKCVSRLPFRYTIDQYFHKFKRLANLLSWLCTKLYKQ